MSEKSPASAPANAPSPSIEKSLERGGARIAYSVSGPPYGVSLDEPAVVLGHSLLCDRRMWQDVAPRLAERRRVISIDVRGHGASTAPGPFSLEDLADDWRAILDAEKIPRAILCGLSMGGMTAMRLALASPERVAALALLDSSADPQPAWERVKFGVMAHVVARFGFLRVIGAAVKPVMFGRTSIKERRELVERQWARIEENDPKALFHGVRAVIDRRSIYERLPTLRCPTLVMVGAEDRATPPERSRRIAAQIPGARLESIERAGHLSALEQPDVVARTLGEFFDSIAVRVAEAGGRTHDQ
ncbi:MAG TPA: alpha/beta fold hydrolase [Polyangia bacterium]|nr:alpha/beta fold hydrolase [Polyangia bacterium]